MKILCHKIPQGFIPVDECADKIKVIPNESIVELTYKEKQNYELHKKMFKFFDFCFQYWRSDREFLDEEKQKEVFRKHLTCLAGYYESYYNIKGEVRIEAKSLSYDKMDADERRRFYTALVNAAMKHIFADCDQSMYDELWGYF